MHHKPPPGILSPCTPASQDLHKKKSLASLKGLKQDVYEVVGEVLGGLHAVATSAEATSALPELPELPLPPLPALPSPVADAAAAVVVVQPSRASLKRQRDADAAPAIPPPPSARAPAPPAGASSAPVGDSGSWEESDADLEKMSAEELLRLFPHLLDQARLATPPPPRRRGATLPRPAMRSDPPAPRHEPNTP